MSLVCGQCSRVNPPEAAYCYHDGAALAGRAGGPINAGAAPFPNQFVFPNGMACRNFDQLAMACQQNWPAALELLKQGFLGSFFGGMGRVDLAMAAQDAAKFPDLDRGLDQLLAKLPTQALQGPKVQAEPSIVNLGLIKINENRASELHLTNLGMRLLYGTVTTDCKWLTLGDAPGHSEKMFQFGIEAVIPVQVRGQHLRAGSKPVEGHLTIDSNGGTVTVTFKADVPITPYAGGLFAGSVTPRQIAEKAKAKAKEAAPLFERGDIAKWYASNGWAYPVQAPIMPGVGAIQQFFEALGVAKAPKVEFVPKSLDLQGAVGKTLETSIEVTTADRKVVYGWATCDQPWVEIGKTKLAGKNASIPITIRIPNPSPPTLTATLNVVGNGNHKAPVRLSVKVAGGKSGVVIQQPDEIIPLEIIEESAPMAVAAYDSPAAAPSPFAFTPDAAPAPMTASEPVEESPFAITDGPPPSSPRSTPSSLASSSIGKPPARMPLLVRLMLHMIPVAILFVCLLGLVVHDIFFAANSKASSGEADENIDPRPFIKLVFDEGRNDENTDTMTFAVHKIDPDNPGKPSVKLNYYANGFGNSTVTRIDGRDFAFGLPPEQGKWAAGSEKGKDLPKDRAKYGGKERTFEYAAGISVTQTVTIEPSDPVEVKPGEYLRLLNTALVRYKIRNHDRKPHTVGLRVLMDTCIGDKDDVPFILPGVRDIVTEAQDFKGRAVPDFVQVIERESLRDPGIIVQLNLSLSDKLEPPSRFQLTRYPVSNDAADKRKILNKWEVPTVKMGDDSSVAIYWDPKKLEPYDQKKPETTRELAFTYGLGSVSLDANKLSVTVGGQTYKDGELTVLALVADRKAKTATLDLPKGLALLEENGVPLTPLTQSVPPMRPDANGFVRPSPVTWRVRASSEGKHVITVKTDTGDSKSRRVTITLKSLFN